MQVSLGYSSRKTCVFQEMSVQHIGAKIRDDATRGGDG
jgi:hypothetical protein